MLEIDRRNPMVIAFQRHTWAGTAALLGLLIAAVLFAVLFLPGQVLAIESVVVKADGM
jgi:hypothetical protein